MIINKNNTNNDNNNNNNNKVMEMLGLDHVADTIVGNHVLRGLSGGQVVVVVIVVVVSLLLLLFVFIFIIVYFKYFF